MTSKKKQHIEKIATIKQFDFEDEEELPKHQNNWNFKVSTIGWTVILLVSLGSLLGLFFLFFNIPNTPEKSPSPLTFGDKRIVDFRDEIKKTEIPEKNVEEIVEKEINETLTPQKPKKISYKPTPKKLSYKRKPVKNNIINITSNPSAAEVIANGKMLGKTPYSWKNPLVYGMVEINVKKEGYISKKLNLEYTGGNVKKHVILVKKEVKAESKQSSPSSEGEPGTVFFSSLPPMADVYVDGTKIGKTNISELKITSGTHTLKFVKGSKNYTETMTFTPGKNPSKLIRLK